MPSCQCGCGGVCGKWYKQGHDAKHKSALIQTVLNGMDYDGSARLLLQEKGWTKFLEASMRQDSPEAQALMAQKRIDDSTQLMSDLREAAQKIKDAGRYEGDDRIQVTHQNYGAILESSLEQIQEWPPSRGEWKEGDEAWFEQYGQTRKVAVTRTLGSRIRIEWRDSQNKLVARIVDVNRLQKELVDA